jgi:magnesium chelatase family protein
MSYATTFCRAALGVDAPLVTVETHLANGLPGFTMVGLPEKAVQEARERVRSALLNSGFAFPPRRITVNLAPADLPKQGSRFDVAIAVGILVASGQVPADAVQGYEFLGELSLAGTLRPIAGVLPAALAAAQHDSRLVLPTGNADEAALVRGLRACCAGHLLEISAHLLGDRPLPPAGRHVAEAPSTDTPDLADVHGQPHARRALEVAAAGRHNLLMMGPPGSGKSMLAARMPGILPPMSETEALQSAAIRSVARLPFVPATWRLRPFRSPHHTASGVALIGGGPHPLPGEVSLAHHGVLFLDELPEFPASVLDVLREPLETGRVLISRAARRAEYPADFQLIAAMNPCKCGYADDPTRACASCSPEKVARYQRRISGPLRDRIDLQIEVPAPPREALLNGLGGAAERSAVVAARVAEAWARQQDRQGTSNARMDQEALARHCTLPPGGERLLNDAIERLRLSARGLHRILRVARTIADLDGHEGIAVEDIAEAVGYRRLDHGGA